MLIYKIIAIKGRDFFPTNILKIIPLIRRICKKTNTIRTT